MQQVLHIYRLVRISTARLISSTIGGKKGSGIAYYQSYSGRGRPRGFWDKVWRDSQGKLVIFQMPNIWLIAWAVLDVVAIFAPSKRAASVAWSLGAAVLSVWALLEIFRGVNYFRRALGVVVLAVTVASVFKIGL